MNRRRIIAAGISIALISIAGCATNTSANRAKALENPTQNTPQAYSGRLSLVIEPVAGSISEAQSFSGSFEIRGNADIGEMDLLTPLGQIVMRLRWRPDIAVILRGNQRQLFADAQDLIQQATGASLSLAQLFAWLQGKDVQTKSAEWQVDLAGYDKGRIIARRTSPTPAVLRIALEIP